jgi:peptide/nickel transport system substrate-binding protein
MRLPSRHQWVKTFSLLTGKERILFLIFSALFLISGVSLAAAFYINNTEVKPAVGGRLVESVAGSPRFINPIYAQSSDVDRDLTEIIFSGLMKYGDQGEIIPDLAEKVEVNEDGTIYEITLKDNVFWHDGKKLDADDVIFTIKTIQNPDYKSPIRANYLGVEVEKISDTSLRFKLKTAFSGFTERLTLKILPGHIWQEISPQNFLLTNYNLKPIGSGPYQFKSLKQDSSGFITSLDLIRNKNYYDDSRPRKPYLSEISFQFLKAEKEKEGNDQKISISLPRYFALFFNADKSRFLDDIKIRQALNYATNKKEIIELALSGQGKTVDSPILPDLYGYAQPAKIYEFSREKADELLAKAGFEKINGQWMKTAKEITVEFKSELKLGSSGKEVTALQNCLEVQTTGYFGDKTLEAVKKFQRKYGISNTGTVGKLTRAKLQEVCSKPAEQIPLKFSLITINDPVLEKAAGILKGQWEALGVGLDIVNYPSSQLEQEIIKPRNYQILLFGEVLEMAPDPFPFWHSSQKKDPGLNLAKYENRDADKLLESARTSLNEEARAKKYDSFQNIVINDAPAVFLYNQAYAYYVSKDIKGINIEKAADPSKRFTNIADWYIKTKRVWK